MEPSSRGFIKTGLPFVRLLSMLSTTSRLTVNTEHICFGEPEEIDGPRVIGTTVYSSPIAPVSAFDVELTRRYGVHRVALGRVSIDEKCLRERSVSFPFGAKP